MGQWKLLCILITSLIVYTLYQRCNIEGLETPKKDKQSCNDDLTWFVEDRSGKKNYCKDIGTSASCYDMDPLQQEGWERCLETCGNCANTSVTVAPMSYPSASEASPTCHLLPSNVIGLFLFSQPSAIHLTALHSSSL